MADSAERLESSRQESSESGKRKPKDRSALIVAGIGGVGVIVAAGIGFLGAILVARSSTENLQDNISQTLQAQHQADERDSRETAYAGFITAFSEGVEAYEAARLEGPRAVVRVGSPGIGLSVQEIDPTPEFPARLSDFDEAVDEVIRTGTLVRMFGSELMGYRVDDAVEEFRDARCNLATSSRCPGYKGETGLYKVCFRDSGPATPNCDG